MWERHLAAICEHFEPIRNAAMTLSCIFETGSILIYCFSPSQQAAAPFSDRAAKF
jgi:hypothetical protein